MASQIASDECIHRRCVILLNILSLPTYLSGRYIQAPYGRHTRSGWGPTLPSWISWLLMESPAVTAGVVIYSRGRNAATPQSLSLIAVFLLHYLHRALIYPLRLRNTAAFNAPFPVSIAAMAFSFNLLNAYVQARWASEYAEFGRWFWVRYGVGVAVFGVGMAVNVGSDRVLVGLKRQGRGYRIPGGGVFEWVSCANYLGEMVEWLGWSIMTCSWAGFGFFLYTCAYLVPRARATHQWYLTKFGEDYPTHRKALIPFLY